MKLIGSIAWILAISGSVYLALGIFSFAANIPFVVKNGFPTQWDSLTFSLSIIGQIVGVILYAVSAISLGLILVQLFNLRDATLRRWSHWRLHGQGISVYAALVLTLKIAAISLMIVRFVQYFYTIVILAQPDYPVMAALSATAWTLLLGFSALAIAFALERLCSNERAIES